MALALIPLLVALAFLALDRPTRIAIYRVIDDRTLVVETTSGPGAWTRVTSVIETAASVTVTVNMFYVQLGPGTGAGIPVESTVLLRVPLADRVVIDGASQSEVARAP